MKTYGTKRATSASGESGPMEAAISAARDTASSRVCGLSFQFPLIKGFRAISRDVEREKPKLAGANAEAEPTRARKERALNFMVDGFPLGFVLVRRLWILIELVDVNTGRDRL
jgi:hypothetical protein